MKRLIGVAVAISVVTLSTIIGYKVATDADLRSRVKQHAQDMFHVSKQRVDEMTEEVALKTAKMTKNPKINQDWVEKQWEGINY